MFKLEADQVSRIFPEDGWRKATASHGNDPDGCLYVNMSLANQDMVAIGDLNNRSAGVFVYDRHEWACFINGAKNGEFDL